MNKRKCAFKLGVFIFTLVPVVAIAEYFDKIAPFSLADHLPLFSTKGHVDFGWLPNLVGLPDETQVLQTQAKVAKMMKDDDPACNAVDSNLRQLIFQHFLLYQQMANAQGIYLNDQIALQWAHLLGMTLKESGGDSSSITAMSGHSISTYKAQTDLQHWNEISSLTPQTRIPLNYQTNFGLTQTSSDRLMDAFNLAKDQQSDITFLEGREGTLTPRKLNLDTKIAIRRLIWLYQDFAQGRLTQTDFRIAQQDANKPEFVTRYHKGLNMALLYCGTRYMFDEKDPQKLQNAMASISYCKLGNSSIGYGSEPVDEECFAKWVTLCPALNIDIAALTPLSYFATRGASPVCVNTFKKMIKHAPPPPQPPKKSVKPPMNEFIPGF